jgi:energy-coupling factor transport system permease protein
MSESQRPPTSLPPQRLQPGGAALTARDAASESLLATLDVRTKLALFAGVTLLALLWDRPLFQFFLVGGLLVVSILAGVRLRVLWTLAKVMAPFCVLLILTHGFFNIQYVKKLAGLSSLRVLFQIPDSIAYVGGAKMSVEGTLFGVTACLKTAALTLLAPLFIFTTPTDRLISGLVRARVPYKLAFVFSATLRFFPMLAADSAAIIDAQRMRGLAVEKMNLFRRLSVYARIAVPLILSSMARSQQLEVVLQSKAFSGSPDRTYLHETQLRLADFVWIALAITAPLAGVYLYIAERFGRFTGGL